MNSELRKAIENLLFESESKFCSQLRLLRVIELLVEQRDKCLQYVSFDEEVWDAELIAALEGEK